MDWFAGLKVLSLETRRGAEMATLIENYGGVATTAPSMREDKQDISERLSDFAARVRAAPERQVLVCMTGIGTRLFFQDLQKYDPEVYAQLQDIQLLSRGTKPTQALKALGFIPVTASRPHTRYLVGSDAKLRAWMVKWLPDRIQDRLLLWALKYPREGSV